MKGRLNLEELWQDALKQAEAALFPYGATLNENYRPPVPFGWKTAPDFDAQTALDTLTKAIGARQT